MSLDHGFLVDDLAAAIADTWPNMMTPYPVVAASVFEEAADRNVVLTKFYVPDSHSYVGVKHLHPNIVWDGHKFVQDGMAETNLCNIRSTLIDWRWPRSHPCPLPGQEDAWWTSTHFLDWVDRSQNKQPDVSNKALCPNCFLYIPKNTLCPNCEG